VLLPLARRLAEGRGHEDKRGGEQEGQAKAHREKRQVEKTARDRQRTPSLSFFAMAGMFLFASTDGTKILGTFRITRRRASFADMQSRNVFVRQICLFLLQVS
jgi:hypothetical protein